MSISTLAVGPFKLAAGEGGSASGDGVAIADCCLAVGATLDMAGRLVADGADGAVAIAPTGVGTDVALGMGVGAIGGAAHEANTAMAITGPKGQYPRRPNVTSPRLVFFDMSWDQYEVQSCKSSGGSSGIFLSGG